MAVSVIRFPKYPLHLFRDKISKFFIQKQKNKRFFWAAPLFYCNAVAADAEYIVTNDSHFNVLKKIDWPKISIITIKELASQIAATE